MRTLAVACLALTACYRGTHDADPTGSPVLAKPACVPEVKIDLEKPTGQVLLGGTDLKLAVDHDEGKSEGVAVVYPHGPHSVLLAWTIYGHYGRPNGNDTLYDVDCVAKTAKPWFTKADGDFGHSVMTRDGKTILFSRTGGIQALDLQTKQIRDVTEPVELKTCGDRQDPEDGAKRIALSAVRSLDDDTLIYEVGDNCGFEGDWDSSIWYLDHPDRPGGKPYEPRPVSAVGVDASGGIWASAGGTCGDPALWHSDDRGDHWTRVALPKLPEDPSGFTESGPFAIVTDARLPGALLVETGLCGGPMGVTLTGRILVTRDRGATWTVLPSPSSNDGEMVGYRTIRLRDGSIDHPIVWSHAEGDTTVDVAQTTADAGDTWDDVDPAPPRPKSTDQATYRGETFRTSPNGLLRSRGAEKPTRLFPH